MSWQAHLERSSLAAPVISQVTCKCFQTLCMSFSVYRKSLHKEPEQTTLVLFQNLTYQNMKSRFCF